MIVKRLAFVGIILLSFFYSDRTVAQTGGVGSPRLLFPIKQGHLWGYADTAKNVVIAPQFDQANPFRGKVAVVEKGRKAFAIDTNGKILTPGFDQLFPLEDTVFSIYLNEVSDTLGGWGITTLSGLVILPPAFDEVVKLNPDVYIFRKDTAWGAVSKNGIRLVDPVYDTIIPAYGNFLLLRKGKYLGLIGNDGKRYLEDEFTRVNVPNAFTIAAYNDKISYSRPKGWGGYDLTPSLYIPFGFDSLFRVSGYVIGVREKDSLGCYFPLASGKPTSISYKKILPLDLYWVKLVDFKSRCGLVDTVGNMVVPVNYSDVTIGGMGFWFVSNEKMLWGVYSGDGKLLLEPQFTRLDPFRSVVTLAYSGTLQGLINQKGELLVAPARQQIIVRGNIVKILLPDSSATFLELNDEGRIISRSNYDVFRVIKIGGREGQVVLDPKKTNSTGAIPYTPRIDSLNWFEDPKTSLWGMRNTFTNDTIIRPQFEFVTPIGKWLTLVGVKSQSPGIIIDGTTSYSHNRMGIVNDSTGRFILRPNYTNIMTGDIGFKQFYGYVRVTLSDGSMALVSTDGSERAIKCTWVESVAGGYARFCTGGKWTINDPGELITDLYHFSLEQDLDGWKSFGVASTSKEFMEKNIRIAGGKWGYLDSTGRIVITASYDGAKPSFAKTGIVKQTKKWGLIGMNAVTIIPCAYDGLSYLHTDSTTILIAQNNDLRYGYIDRNGNIAIPADLKQSKSLGKGFIGFSRTGKWGVMNTKGETVCAENYHEILPFSEGYAAVRKGNKWGYVDTSGTEIIAPKFERAGEFRNGIARVVMNHKWGYVDLTGNTVIEAVYLQAGNFSGLSAPVKTRDGYGLIDRKGKWLLKPTWEKIVQLDSVLEGYFVVRNQYLSGICRSDGKIILSPRYEGYKYLGEGRISYRSSTKYGIIDTTGRMVTQSIFDQVKPYSEHYAAVVQDGRWGYIGLTGKFIIEPKYMVAGKFLDHQAYVYSPERSGEFIDTTGRTLYRLRGRLTLLGYSEGKYLIGELDKNKQVKDMFFMTRHGVMLNRYTYKEAMLFQDGAARVRTGVTWGLVSYAGYYIIKPHFFLIAPFDNGLARFQMRYRQGAFALDGKPILPVEYDAVYFDEELNLIRFEKGNALGYLFEDGRVCWPEHE